MVTVTVPVTDFPISVAEKLAVKMLKLAMMLNF